MSEIQEKQYEQMLTKPIPSLIITMAIPTVVSMLITVAYNTADTYFVSQINKSASAAVGAVYAVMALIQAVGYGFSMGAGSLISRCLGQKENEKAERYASSALFGVVLSGVVLMVLGLAFLTPILTFIGCSDTMLPYAKDYAYYIFLFAPLNCATFVLNGVLRAGGQMKEAMLGVGVGGVLNVILDPLFIFTWDMGVGGAALATVVSQNVSFALLSIFFVLKKTVVPIRLKSVSFRLSDYGKILSSGLPTVFRQGMGALSSALLTVQAVVYGDAVVSALTIAGKVYVLVRNVVLGIGQGFQPVAGYNYGAGNRKRTWSSFVFTCLFGSGLCLVCAGLLFAFPHAVMTWFSNDEEVVTVGVQTLYYLAAVMPLLAFSTYLNQLYQCLGYKWRATLLACCRQGIFYVPCILLLPMAFGCLGVQVTQPLADLLTAVVSVPFAVYFYYRMIKKGEPRAKT